VAAHVGQACKQLVYDEVPFMEVGKFNSVVRALGQAGGLYQPAIWPYFWNTGLTK
jgi:peptide/nickel transport system substrate-binding protein